MIATHTLAIRFNWNHTVPGSYPRGLFKANLKPTTIFSINARFCSWSLSSSPVHFNSSSFLPEFSYGLLFLSKPPAFLYTCNTRYCGGRKLHASEGRKVCHFKLVMPVGMSQNVLTQFPLCLLQFWLYNKVLNSVWPRLINIQWKIYLVSIAVQKKLVTSGE